MGSFLRDHYLVALLPLLLVFGGEDKLSAAPMISSELIVSRETGMSAGPLPNFVGSYVEGAANYIHVYKAFKYNIRRVPDTEISTTLTAFGPGGAPIVAVAEKGETFPVLARICSVTGCKLKVGEPDWWLFHETKDSRRRHELVYCQDPQCQGLAAQTVSALDQTSRVLSGHCQACSCHTTPDTATPKQRNGTANGQSSQTATDVPAKGEANAIHVGFIDSADPQARGGDRGGAETWGPDDQSSAEDGEAWASVVIPPQTKFAKGGGLQSTMMRFSELDQITQKDSSWPEHKGMAENCAKIMSTNGTIGPWGELLLEKIQDPNYQATFMKDGALGSLCPNFNNLRPEVRARAWVWAFTVLANEESMCMPNYLHRTLKKSEGKWVAQGNFVGLGLWAMELSPYLRRARGPACSAIKEVKDQVACTMSIMKGQIEKWGSATAENNYWGPALPHRHEKQMQPSMRRLAACFDEDSPGRNVYIESRNEEKVCRSFGDLFWGQSLFTY